MRLALFLLSGGLATVLTAPQTPTSTLGQSRLAGRNVWDSVYTDAQADRGAKVYTLSCARCHGEQLEGIDDATPLVGDAFFSSWNGSSVGDLIDRIRTTMPTGEVGSLNLQQVADVVAFTLRANKFPAGPRELAASVDSTLDIAITTARP